MSRTLWELLCEIKSYDDIISIFSPHYEKYFPIEIRHYLAEWFENQICSSPSSEDMQFYNFAVQFQNSLIEKIETLAESIDESENVDNAARKFRFYEASGKLRYFTPDGLLNDLCSIMEHERYLYTNKSMSKSLQRYSSDDAVKKLELKSVQIENIFNLLTNIFQNYQCELFDAQSNLAVNEHEVQQIARDIKSDYMKKQIMEKRDELLNALNCYIESSYNVADEIINDQIEPWKEHQKMFSGNAFVDLQNIQKWCEKISNSLHKVNEIILQFDEFHHTLCQFDNNFIGNGNILKLSDAIQKIFFKLARSSLVIEEQPSQIIKIGNKIKTSIRLLVGSEYHDKNHIPCVEALIVSESKARYVLQNGAMQGKPSGELLHFSANMATNKSKQFSANFRNMQLKTIERSTKRDVTDEKFCICFSTVLKFSNIEMPITIMSLPIVVIVHVNQESSALATIIWDSFFGKINRVPFEIPNSVSWMEFSIGLSKMFKEEVGRELSAENLHFIAEKFYDRDLPFPFENSDEEKVTWSDFCKRKISGKDFTFWEWIYLILKLIKENLLNYWHDGYVEGFISKGNIEKKLRDAANGTFVMRFSDNSKGSISIAYVTTNSLGRTSVMHVQPFSTKDLIIRSLTDRLNAFDELKFLYPNLEKKSVFKSDEFKFLSYRDRHGYIIPLRTSRLPSYYEINKKIAMD